MKAGKGFTLVELVIVLVVLGVLAVVALSRYINLGSDARIAALEQVMASAHAANDMVQLKAKMPSYASRPAEDRDDLTDVDLDGDGFFETRLKCGFLDNTDVAKRLTYSDDRIVYNDDDKALVYFGLDTDPDEIEASQCYFVYRQSYGTTNVSQCNPDDEDYEPQYRMVTTGC
ncbi:prepilin-type N-terminal cleavage/methylation domain-containing protein [Ferrimonas balearica]|uniref:prepilin-type N-terminal cleavage/methylation domain-containing protein n=1 Tax=Ferrimonas balearica TaxID=44012 RepID=UPI001C583FF4|nr:prepilin-type N-terminal cleavage/methylation domain-containing protein [Ferrimonas balearica]MBW3164530.1 prepilin-type N-terminal cleavage/methylation domain-containing protein [Ferrimonas balearica]